MTGQSVFEKRHIDPSKMSKFEGLLEHFNLPPKVVAYYRENKKTVKLTAVMVVGVVVAVSLYGSWREQKIEEGGSALTLALALPADQQQQALVKVSESYASTPSGHWAQIELAHLDMKTKAYGEAVKKYTTIKNKLKADNPALPLVIYGIAQAEEAQANYDAAYAAYSQLKDIEAYRLSGYTGMARIHEIKGELDKALAVYGQFTTLLSDPTANAETKRIVDEKIARIKAKQ